jgi:dTDP-4-dehydrorhamnose 3,5-epimerase
MNQELKFTTTTVEGLIVLDLPVHGDARGWFKENFQRQKLTVSGTGQLPDLKVVQNNISFNANRGVTRGLHAEPWDKYISVATGSVFGAWVDLRAGSATYGQAFTTTITPDKAIFVPRGVANGFQALEDNTAYTYLVNAHWSASLKEQYTFLNLKDPTAAVNWPIPLNSPEVEISESDQHHPFLDDVQPMLPKTTLVVGANGQLGRAVRQHVQKTQPYPQTFRFTDVVANAELGVEQLDLLKEEDVAKIEWANVGTIINCAAYTAVDLAETADGRKLAWKLNVKLPQLLAQKAIEHDITLVHISSDYVFDGQLCDHPSGVPCNNECSWSETADLSPLGVYASTKAAGDVAVELAPKHYILRTSWVIGDGNNFVKTMLKLSQNGVAPEVVNDQFGRLTFTTTLAEAIFHLLNVQANWGIYNLTNSGKPTSWYKIAQTVFELSGNSAQNVHPISTADYLAKNTVTDENGQTKLISPRPVNSVLLLDKIATAKYAPTDWQLKLEEYVKDLL